MLLFATAVGVVLVVSFMCSIFESVLLSVTRPQIEVLVRDGRRAGSLLAGFKQNMDVPIAGILILNTAAHTVGASLAGASYADAFSADTLWLFTILFTVAVLFFTEIIPKTLGVSYATVLAPKVAYGIHWLVTLLRPFVAMSERVSRSLRSKNEAPITSPEEIRLLASLGHSEGVVGSGMADMIVGATHLSHLRTQDVMLPRENVHFMSGLMKREDALALLRETGHSRFPFSPTSDIDDVSGIVLVKELLDHLLLTDSNDIDWASLRKDALMVPETSPLPRLLRTFQDSRLHLAIVIDEYGSVMGIASLEDVLEEVVGEIYDETDEPAADIVERPDGSLRVSANVDLRRLSTRLDIPWVRDGDVATVGGLVMETLEHIPTVGDSIDWQGHRITVLRAGRKRAKVLSVCRN